MPNIIKYLYVLLQPNHHEYVYRSNQMKVTPLDQTYERKPCMFEHIPLACITIMSIMLQLLSQLFRHIICFKKQSPIINLINSSYDPKTNIKLYQHVMIYPC